MIHSKCNYQEASEVKLRLPSTNIFTFSWYYASSNTIHHSSTDLPSQSQYSSGYFHLWPSKRRRRSMNVLPESISMIIHVKNIPNKVILCEIAMPVCDKIILMITANLTSLNHRRLGLLFYQQKFLSYLFTEKNKCKYSSPYLKRY